MKRFLGKWFVLICAIVIPTGAIGALNLAAWRIVRQQAMIDARDPYATSEELWTPNPKLYREIRLTWTQPVLDPAGVLGHIKNPPRCLDEKDHWATARAYAMAEAGGRDVTVAVGLWKRACAAGLFAEPLAARAYAFFLADFLTLPYPTHAAAQFLASADCKEMRGLIFEVIRKLNLKDDELRDVLLAMLANTNKEAASEFDIDQARSILRLQYPNDPAVAKAEADRQRILDAPHHAWLAAQEENRQALDPKKTKGFIPPPSQP